MLIGALDAHIELQPATLDDAATRAILAALRTLPPSSPGRKAPSSSVA
jgi:hypothetical protein